MDFDIGINRPVAMRLSGSTEWRTGQRESVKDFAANLSWWDGIVARVFDHTRTHWVCATCHRSRGEPARNLYHPCQALADS